MSYEYLYCPHRRKSGAAWRKVNFDSEPTPQPSERMQLIRSNRIALDRAIDSLSKQPRVRMTLNRISQEVRKVQKGAEKDLDPEIARLEGLRKEWVRGRVLG